MVQTELDQAPAQNDTSFFDRWEKPIIQALREYQPPSSLYQGLDDLWEIPGMETYLNRPGGKLYADYLRMAQAALDEVDSAESIRFAAHTTALSEEEVNQLFSSPATSPYKSELQFGPSQEQQARQYLIIGNALRTIYEDLARGEEQYRELNLDDQTKKYQTAKEEAGKVWLNFGLAAAACLLIRPVLELEDRYYQVDPEQRKQGKIQLQDLTRTMIDDLALEAANNNQGQASVLSQAVIAATNGGDLRLAEVFLRNNQGSPQLRTVLEKILVRLSQDQALLEEKVCLTILSQRFLARMGLNLATIFALKGYSSPEEIETQLTGLLENEDHNNELRHHLQAEANQALQEAEDKGEPVDYFQAFAKRAQHWQFPDRLPSNVEMVSRNQEVDQFLQNVWPLTQWPKLSEFGQIVMPSRNGAARRPWGITWFNQTGKLFITTILDPLQSMEKLIINKGHELCHFIHHQVAYLAGIRDFSASSYQRAMGELLADLVEYQLGKLYRQTALLTDQTSAIKPAGDDLGQLWPSLERAIGTRLDTLRGWCQVALRRMIETDYRSVQEFNNQEVREIINKLDAQLRGLQQQGPLSVRFPHLTLANSLNPLIVDDHLVYVLPYLRPKKTATEQLPGEKQDELDQSLQDKYGELWLQNKRARLVLIKLMLETARGVQDEKELAKLVREADLDALNKEVSALGIPLEEI